MPLVLVIGDLHVPYRSASLCAEFSAMLVPDKMQYILSTGNLCTKQMYNMLRGLSSDIHVVQGDFDTEVSSPEEKVVQIGNFRVGLIHGHQVIPWGDKESLALVQRRMDCDILVSGHTHQYSAYEYMGAFFVNPGSATGAYSSLEASTTPSFVLMDIDGDKATCYVYKYTDGDVSVEKVEYTKQK